MPSPLRTASELSLDELFDFVTALYVVEHIVLAGDVLTVWDDDEHMTLRDRKACIYLRALIRVWDGRP